MAQQNKKRGWIYDGLMQVGQKLASVNHLEEKLIGLTKDAEEAEDPETAYKLAEEISHVRKVIRLLVDSRRQLMDYIFDSVDGSNREYYCLLKHALHTFVLSSELFEALNDDKSEDMFINSGRQLASAISLALGFEFKQCLRCLDEIIKKESDEIIKSRK